MRIGNTATATSAQDDVGGEQPDRRHDDQQHRARGERDRGEDRRRRRRCRRRRGRRGRRRAGGACHDIGWRTSRSTTPRLSDPATRHCVLPAHVRRTTTPHGAHHADADDQPDAGDHRADGDDALVEAGDDDVVDDPRGSPRSRRRCRGRRRRRRGRRRRTVEGAVRTSARDQPEPLAGALEALRGSVGDPTVHVFYQPLADAPVRAASVDSGRGPDRRRVARGARRLRAVPRLPRLQQGLRWRRPGGHGAVVRVARHALAARAGPLAASTEIGAGLLFAAGLLTPFAAAGMIGVMVVAGWSAHRRNGFFIFPRGGVGVRGVDRRRRLVRRHDRPRRAQPRSRHRARLDGAGRLDRRADRRRARGRRGSRPARHLLPPCAAGSPTQ